MINARTKPSEFNPKTLAIAGVAVLAVVFGGYKLLSGGSGDVYGDSPVVAHVNGEPVHYAQADEVSKSIFMNGDKPAEYSELDEKTKMMVIREIAAKKLLVEAAESKGFEKQDQADIDRRMAEFKDKLVFEKFSSKFAKEEITEDKMRSKYDEIEKALKGKAQYKVSHILVKTEGEAEKAATRAEKEGFSKVAKDVSLDAGTKQNGGSFGYIEGSRDADFEKAVAGLKQGEVSGPVKTKFGWHIIKLDEKKPASVPSFDKLKNQIMVELYNESIRKYADDLLADAKIKLEDAPAAKEDKVEGSAEKNEKKDEEGEKGNKS